MPTSYTRGGTYRGHDQQTIDAIAAASSSSSGATGGGGNGGKKDFSSDVRFEEYVIQKTGVIEQCFDGVKCVSALIYATGGTTAGVFQPAVATTYMGRTAKHLNEQRAVGDEYFAMEISETPLSELQPIRLFVKGTAGTVVVAVIR